MSQLAAAEAGSLIVRAHHAVAAVAILASALPAAAAVPKWIKSVVDAEGHEQPTSTGMIVLLDRTEVRVNPRLEAQVHLRRVMRVQNGDGARETTLEIHLEPGASIVEAEGWTIRDGDVATEVGREQVLERNFTAEGYTDTRVATLRMPGAKAGDLVAFDVAWSEVRPFPSYSWFPQESPAPVRRAELELDLPAHWSAKPFAFGMKAAPPAASGNRVSIGVDDLPELLEETDSPGIDEASPRVFVRFDAPAADASLDTWDKIAAWYSRASAASLAAEACPRDLRPTGAGAGTREDLDYLAATVQRKIRYVAVELGMQRWIPDRADVTWGRGYGDCKDKAAVLISALSAHGFEAKPALVRARPEGDVELGSPDPGQFNHCVVAIAWHGDTTLSAATVAGRSGKRWTVFDPTSETTPLGAISTMIGGAWALIADPAEGMVQLPEATPSRLSVELNGQLSETGALSGQLKFWARGPESDELRAELVSVSSAERQWRARRLLQARWPMAHMDTCRAVFQGARDQGAGFAIDFNLPAAAYPTANAWILTPDFYLGQDATPPADSIRRTSLVLGEPSSTIETWDVALPAGWTLDPAPAIEWHSAEANYAAHFSGGGARLHVERRFDLWTRSIPAARCLEGERLLRAVYAGDHCPLTIEQR